MQFNSLFFASETFLNIFFLKKSFSIYFLLPNAPKETPLTRHLSSFPHDTYLSRGAVSAVCPRHVLSPASLLSTLWTGAPQPPTLSLINTHMEINTLNVNSDIPEKKKKKAIRTSQGTKMSCEITSL